MHSKLNPDVQKFRKVRMSCIDPQGVEAAATATFPRFLLAAQIQFLLESPPSYNTKDKNRTSASQLEAGQRVVSSSNYLTTTTTVPVKQQERKKERGPLASIGKAFVNVGKAIMILILSPIVLTGIIFIATAKVIHSIGTIFTGGRYQDMFE
ncbi:hypothetical protein C8J56DRAFT_1034847 [Mycena floridula]|nr:hypothetical protein C8J56DRAFT_1034847 [Mycena floridula]